MEAAREDDPELGELRETLGAVKEAMGINVTFTVRDLIDTCAKRRPTQIGEPTEPEFPELADALERIAGDRGSINSRRLGKWLAAREGRIVAGLRFVRSRAADHARVVRWRVAAP